MAKYIEQAVLIKTINDNADFYGSFGDNMITSSELLRCIELTPAVDVQPIIRGQLKSTGMDELYAEFGDCSVCGGDNYIKAKFCNWCGAKLREVDDGNL